MQMKKVTSLVGMLALAVTLNTPFAAAENVQIGITEYNLSVEQLPIFRAKPPVLETLGISGRFQKDNFKSGEFARLTIEVDQAATQKAYVALVQVDSRGVFNILFPNTYQKNPEVAGPNKFEVRGSNPKGLQVYGDAGDYIVKLIASTDEQALIAALTGLSSINDLVVRLNDTRMMKPGSWAAHTVGYRILPGGQDIRPPGEGEVGGPPGQGGIGGSPWQEAPDAPVQPPEQTPPPPAPEAKPPFDFNSLASDFHLSITPRNSRRDYQVNDSLAFSIQSEKDCKLSLVYFSPEGVSTVFFPNKVIPQVDVDEGKALWLPSSDAAVKLVADKPGEHTYLAICDYRKGFFEGLFGSNSQNVETSSQLEVGGSASMEELLKHGPDDRKAYAHTTINVK